MHSLHFLLDILKRLRQQRVRDTVRVSFQSNDNLCARGDTEVFEEEKLGVDGGSGSDKSDPFASFL
jgi:hypothetical protein